MRPGARLAMLVWQRRDDNEWAVATGRALDHPAQQGDGLDPFSLGEPRATEDILDRAGFQDVRFDDVHEPMFFGNDVSSLNGTVSASPVTLSGAMVTAASPTVSVTVSMSRSTAAASRGVR